MRNNILKKLQSKEQNPSSTINAKKFRLKNKKIINSKKKKKKFKI